MSTWPVVLPIILGGIATLAIYSFLVKENPFYRFFEHLYIGVATGFGFVFGVQRFLWPEVFRPMFGYDREIFANGEFDRPWRDWYLVFLLPFAFGMLYYFIYSRKRQWLSRVVIAWSLGVSGGFAVKGFFAQYMPQIIGSFKPLVAVQTVERNLLIGFRDVAERLPANAQIVKGRIELFRIGLSYMQVVYKKDGKLETVAGRVVGLNDDPQNGSITLEVDNKEQTIANADVVKRIDIAAPDKAPDAFEGHGGDHLYLAYRTLRAWDPERTDGAYRRHPADTGSGSRETLLSALRTPGDSERVKAVEDALAARLGPADTELVMKLKPADAAGVNAAAERLFLWHPADDYAPSAESNTGMTLLVLQNVPVKDPYRAEEWKAGVREAVGFKASELSPETLRSWYDRPETNFGVIMQRKAGAGGSYLHRFASARHPDPARRPRLVIEYRVPGDDKPKELVLQNGVEGYDGTLHAITVSGVNQPAPIGQEFLLGATARKPDGALSLDFWSAKGILANWIFVITLICVMTYFLFSFEHNRPGIYQASMAGRWLMMLCFGAFFGSTIMARMALLVERMQFVIEKWIPTLFGLG